MSIWELYYLQFSHKSKTVLKKYRILEKDVKTQQATEYRKGGAGCRAGQAGPLGSSASAVTRHPQPEPEPACPEALGSSQATKFQSQVIPTQTAGSPRNKNSEAGGERGAPPHDAPTCHHSPHTLPPDTVPMRPARDGREGGPLPCRSSEASG